MGRVEITRLIKNGDRVVGAAGFHGQSGASILIHAKAVILAAHSGGWKGTSDLVDELTYYYDGLCEQDVLKDILELSYDRFMDLEKMGHRFYREDGVLQSIPQRGLDKMRYYFYHPYGKGGSHTTEVLNKRLQELNVKR